MALADFFSPFSDSKLPFFNRGRFGNRVFLVKGTEAFSQKSLFVHYQFPRKKVLRTPAFLEKKVGEKTTAFGFSFFALQNSILPKGKMGLFLPRAKIGSPGNSL